MSPLPWYVISSCSLVGIVIGAILSEALLAYELYHQLRWCSCPDSYDWDKESPDDTQQVEIWQKETES